MKKYLTRRQVAEAYPLTVGQLARWAANDMGPPYILRGRALYPVAELEAWLEAGRVSIKNVGPGCRKVGRPRKKRQSTTRLPD